MLVTPVIAAALLCSCATQRETSGDAEATAATTITPPKRTVTPSEVVEGFSADLASGNIAAARARLYAGDPPPEAEAEVLTKLRDWAESAKTGRSMAVVAERIDGDCAVVIVHDRPTAAERRTFIDLDPVFLRRGGDDWVMIMESPLRPNRFINITAEEQARFQSLHEWFETEQPNLQAALRTENRGGEQP